MRRCLIAFLLLCLALLAAGHSVTRLEELTGSMEELLLRAETLGTAGNREEALFLTRQAHALWEEHSLFFHVLLHHSDTDAVSASFREVRALLLCRETGEYAAASAALIERIGLLCEQERLTLKNLL